MVCSWWLWVFRIFNLIGVLVPLGAIASIPSSVRAVVPSRTTITSLSPRTAITPLPSRISSSRGRGGAVATIGTVILVLVLHHAMHGILVVQVDQ